MLADWLKLRLKRVAVLAPCAGCVSDNDSTRGGSRSLAHPGLLSWHASGVKKPQPEGAEPYLLPARGAFQIIIQLPRMRARRLRGTHGRDAQPPRIFANVRRPSGSGFPGVARDRKGSGNDAQLDLAGTVRFDMHGVPFSSCDFMNCGSCEAPGSTSSHANSL
jgi:hypothetical protein